jgi:hypothetical protein
MLEQQQELNNALREVGRCVYEAFRPTVEALERIASRR